VKFSCIDSPSTGDLASGLVIDPALLLCFTLEDSVMARWDFKRWLTRLIPETAERSTYVLTRVSVRRLLLRYPCLAQAGERVRLHLLQIDRVVA